MISTWAIGVKEFSTLEMFPWAIGLSAFIVAKMKMVYLMAAGWGLHPKGKRVIIFMLSYFGIIGGLLLLLLCMPFDEGFESAQARIWATIFPMFVTFLLMLGHWFFWDSWETKYDGWEYDARLEFKNAGNTEDEIQEKINKLKEVCLGKIFDDLKKEKGIVPVGAYNDMLKKLMG
jgi:hypothetical protein